MRIERRCARGITARRKTDGQQSAAELKLVRTVTVGEEAELADAHQAGREHMK